MCRLPSRASHPEITKLKSKYWHWHCSTHLHWQVTLWLTCLLTTWRSEKLLPFLSKDQDSTNTILQGHHRCILGYVPVQDNLIGLKTCKQPEHCFCLYQDNNWCSQTFLHRCHSAVEIVLSVWDCHHSNIRWLDSKRKKCVHFIISAVTTTSRNILQALGWACVFWSSAIISSLTDRSAIYNIRFSRTLPLSVSEELFCRVFPLSSVESLPLKPFFINHFPLLSWNALSYLKNARLVCARVCLLGLPNALLEKYEGNHAHA